MLIPNFVKSIQLNQNNRAIMSKISILRQKDERLSTLNEEEFKVVIPKIVKVMPSSKDYVSLFTTFDELQSKSGVSILRTDFQLGEISVNPGKQNIEAGTGPYPIPITIEILGDIVRISNFLSSLADLSGRLILVDNIQLEVKEESLIKASIAAKAYFNPQPFSIGNIDSELPQLTVGGEKIFTQIMQSEVIAVESDSASDIVVGNNTLFY